MTEWDIQPRAEACTACQKPFAGQETYHTLLSMSASGYARRDLCTSCFASAARDGVISYWQGEFKLPAPPPPEPIQRETAETLLRKLVESKDPTHEAARYILAVMLERKRIFKHRDTVREDGGSTLLIYEHARTGESFTIPDPNLRLDQLARVQEEVTTLLHGPSKSTEAGPVNEPGPGV